jgi:two-component system, NtrC family, nitrogen regulation response regulator NtrX
MNILVVDDDANICESLDWLLRNEGHRVQIARSGEQGLKALEGEPFALVFLDVMMPGIGGLTALEKMLERDPAPVVIMISGAADVSAAVRATRAGAYNFLEKPLRPEKVLLEVQRLQEQMGVRSEMQRLQTLMEQDFRFIGSSPAMQQLFKLIRTAAPSDGRILIHGENGTGKELAARAIHQNSLRKDRPFVQLNCAAIPKELIESELFGYEKGAFTGATQRKPGLIERAHNGTLLLDEVGDMALETQAKLLRVLQENEFYRVGGTSPIKFDVRIIAATNKDLEQEISAGRFRQDLFYRLNVIPVRVPPLREHLEDLPALADHFLTGYCLRNGKPGKRLGEEALLALKSYSWPGNVRELKNIMERLAIMCDEEMVGRAAVEAVRLSGRTPVPAGTPGDELPLREQLKRHERAILESGLRKYQGNISRLALELQIDRANLHRKLKQLKLLGR